MSEREILKNKILSQKPTEQQQGAIFAEEVEFLLRAAPGSGKTWTSCRRFIWRGANWPYSVGGLALLSFTNAAVREFYAATIKIERRDLLSDPNYLGTFDAFIERFIMCPFGHLLAGLSKRPKLFNEPRPSDRNNDKLRFWMDLGGGKGVFVYAWEIVPFPDDGRVAFRGPVKYGGRKLHISGRNPVTELMTLGYYTHEQRAYWACSLLLARTHIAELIARRFPEIIIDEAQDTNIWLLTLLNILRNKGAKITLVGDQDQCIYEFSMANPNSLQKLRKEWDIPEKPLSRSFRCNNQIASAVRNIVGNQAFSGCGDCAYEQRRPIVIRDSSKRFSTSVMHFQQTLLRCGIDESASAIICRGYDQLYSIHGDITYTNLKGITKNLAEASFLRDCRKDYSGAVNIVEKTIRSISAANDLWDIVDEYPDSEESLRIRIAMWRFVKSQSGLPSVHLSGNEWISQIRETLGKLMTGVGIGDNINLNRFITKKGLDDQQVKLPLLQVQSLFPSIRQETILKVKGQSIDAVLVLGSPKFWNSVVNAIVQGTNSEDRRIAYVAMTRARHLLVVGLPAAHFQKHVNTWISWGFETA